MADVQQDLEAAAAELITRLPDNWLDQRLPELEESVALRQTVASVMEESLDAIADVLVQAVSRPHQPDQPLNEVTTEAEQAAFDAAWLRYFDAERAHALLESWAERSGMREEAATR